MDQSSVNDINKLLKIDPVKVSETCISFLKSELIERKKDGICIGISGGIDSSTVLYLSLRSVEDPKKIFGFYLYDKSNSKETRKRAIMLADETEINFEIRDITKRLKERGTYDSIWVKLTSISRLLNRSIKQVYYLMPRWFKKRLGVGRVLYDVFQKKHRVRREILEEVSEKNNLMLVGGGNRTEVFGGWYTYGGIDDIEVEPLFNLYKTQVIELAKFLEIPEEVINVDPSHDMLLGLGTEDLINVKFDVIDRVAYIIENDLGKEYLDTEGIDRKVYCKLLERHEETEWKRTNPHVFPDF